MASAPTSTSSHVRLTSTITSVLTSYYTTTLTIPNPTGTGSVLTTETAANGTAIRTSGLPHPTGLVNGTSPGIAAAPGSNNAVIAGGVTGSLSAVAAIGIIGFLFWKRRRNSASEVTETTSEKPYEPKKDIAYRERRSFHQL